MIYNGGMKNIEFTEYGPVVPGIFAPGEPGCPFIATIPTLTVENVAGLKGLANCLVHVSANNTTYYIDDKHRIVTTWAGPVEADNYDYVNNPLGLRSQEVWDFANNRVIRYNSVGAYMVDNLGA